ncbi:MAG: hypothetical protein JW730_21460 [Anaerolineales bacterium]|nr:hypothetical protein [Anaerolineales bacterium]
METTIPRTSGSGFGKLLIIILLLAIIGASVVMMTQAHARRHDRHVANIPDKCNSNSFQVHMFRQTDNRDAYLCFVEGYFVVSIWNFTKESIEKWGDDEVTSFSRPSAHTIDELIRYMESTGYTVVP